MSESRCLGVPISLMLATARHTTRPSVNGDALRAGRLLKNGSLAKVTEIHPGESHSRLERPDHRVSTWLVSERSATAVARRPTGEITDLHDQVLSSAMASRQNTKLTCDRLTSASQRRATVLIG